jgi:hypothetical protein
MLIQCRIDHIEKGPNQTCPHEWGHETTPERRVAWEHGQRRRIQQANEEREDAVTDAGYDQGKAMKGLQLF